MTTFRQIVIPRKQRGRVWEPSVAAIQILTRSSVNPDFQQYISTINKQKKEEQLANNFELTCDLRDISSVRLRLRSLRKKRPPSSVHESCAHPVPARSRRNPPTIP